MPNSQLVGYTNSYTCNIPHEITPTVSIASIVSDDRHGWCICKVETLHPKPILPNWILLNTILLRFNNLSLSFVRTSLVLLFSSSISQECLLWKNWWKQWDLDEELLLKTLEFNIEFIQGWWVVVSNVTNILKSLQNLFISFGDVEFLMWLNDQCWIIILFSSILIFLKLKNWRSHLTSPTLASLGLKPYAVSLMHFMKILWSKNSLLLGNPYDCSTFI